MAETILILVPHPDDEIVACAAAIGRAKSAGARIFALYLTHGCIARDAMWPWERKRYEKIVARRRAEGEEAARFLGIKPLGWSERPARYLWREMAQVHAKIEAAIAKCAADRIWVPAYEGGNPDHDALNAIAQKFKNRCRVEEFAAYNFYGGQANAQCFPFPNGSEQAITLTETESAAKRAALALYVSEKSNLNYVGTKRECHRPLALYDYARPPHAGTLWYARFQWVPFRHPRVDFTDPAEVSAEIGSFLNK